MYYLKKKGKVFGPFPLEKLKNMVKQEKLSPENFISDDRSKWVEAAQIKELFPELAGSGFSSKLQAEVQPVVNLQKELNSKTKCEKNDISVIPEVEPVPLLSVEECQINFFAVFWNPVYALPLINEKYEKSIQVLLGLVFIFCNTLIFLIAGLLSGIYVVNVRNILISMLISVVPFILLLINLLLFSKIFAADNDIKVQENILISGITLLPACLVLLFVTLVKLTGFFIVPQIIVLLSGLEIYAFAYAVLLLFNACTRLLGIRGSGTVFVVSSLLLFSIGITAFLIKLLLL